MVLVGTYIDRVEVAGLDRLQGIVGTLGVAVELVAVSARLLLSEGRRSGACHLLGSGLFGGGLLGSQIGFGFSRSLLTPRASWGRFFRYVHMGNWVDVVFHGVRVFHLRDNDAGRPCIHCRSSRGLDREQGLRRGITAGREGLIWG